MKLRCFFAFVSCLPLIGTIAICGCSSDNKTMTDSIEAVHDSTWRLDQLDGQSIPVEAPPITMQLVPAKEKKKKEQAKEDGKASGSTGVNQYFGTYESDKPGSIRFGPLAATRRAGPPDAMQRESQFLTEMGRVSTYRLHGDMMSMGDGDTSFLVWRR